MQSVAELLLQGQKVYPWTLDGFTIEPFADNNDTEVAVVHLQSGPDQFTRHAALLDIGKRFEKEGFTVNYMNFHGDTPPFTDDQCPDTSKFSNLIHHLHVSIVRAESKLLWQGNMAVDNQQSPNFKGLLASGPLMREEGMQPRRVVMWDKGYADPGRYVTHVQCVPDGTGETCKPYLDGGRYFRNIGPAVDSFTERVKKMHMDIFPDEWR